VSHVILAIVDLSSVSMQHAYTRCVLHIQYQKNVVFTISRGPIYRRRSVRARDAAA
jgi:hypothetical protein